MVKKTFLITFIATLMLCLIVLQPSVSALSFDNIKGEKSVTFDGKSINDNALLQKYKPIEITNNFGFGSKLFEGYLSKHDESCGTNCESIIEIKLGSDSPLIDAVEFLTLQEDNSWIKQDVRSYQFYIKTQGNKIDVNDYETQCIETGVSKNGTVQQSCNQVLVGTHKEDAPVWTPYNIGEEMPEGTYTVKLDADKKASRTVDWVITTQGKKLSEWAVWGNISLGDDAEVILNSPANNSIQYTNLITTNASATVTGGATLVNATLYDNSTGSWGARNTTTLAENYSESNGAGLGSSKSGSEYAGYILTIGNSPINLVNVTKHASAGAMFAHVYSGSTKIATASFSGDTATFSSPITLNANTNYIVVANATGSYTKRYNTGASYPIQETHFNWTCYVNAVTINGNCGGTSEAWNINGIGYSLLPTSSTKTWSNTYSSGSVINWNMQFCDSDGDCGFAPSNYTFSVDDVAPSVVLNYPTSLIDYGAVNGSLQLNFTATDSNLDKVWYDYNGTNITIAGATSGVYNISNITLSTKKNVTIFANDTAGNLNASTFSWDYKVFENSQNYSAITTSGAIETFNLNLTLGSGISLSSASLIYGNQTVSTNIYSSGQNRLIEVSNFELPAYTIDTNVSFYWNLTITGGVVQTLNNTQLVQAVLLDNCSVYTYPIFNISLFNEETKNPIYGDIQINYQILNKPSYNTIQVLNYGLTNVTNTSVCSGINLTGQNLAYSSEIRYVSDGYAPELYHIQRADIGSSAEQLNLYDLNLNDSTEFKIVYQDNDYSFVDGAIVQLQRKYISEGIYRIVEAPLTSNEGTAVVHIDLNSNKYKATIVKNGEVLDIFDNLVFNCESPLTGQCTQQLLGTINPQNSLDLQTLLDFTYTNPTIVNETVSLTFSVPSGAPTEVNLVLIQKDMFGNSTLCNQTITSSGGSIECNFNRSIGDSFLELWIYKNGELIMQSTYVIPEEGVMDFLGNNFFIVLILLLSLVGMAVTSPEWVIVNGVITFVIAGSIWLLNGLDFVVGLGSLMWLLIASAILIFKLAKQEDR